MVLLYLYGKVWYFDINIQCTMICSEYLGYLRSQTFAFFILRTYKIFLLIQVYCLVSLIWGLGRANWCIVMSLEPEWTVEWSVTKKQLISKSSCKSNFSSSFDTTFFTGITIYGTLCIKEHCLSLINSKNDSQVLLCYVNI